MSQISLKKNALLNVVKTLMGIIFPIITFPYASRILLPEGIGKVNFTNSVISYFVMLAGLGLGTYGIRECAKVRDNKNSLSILVKELFSIQLISTIISYLLFMVVFFFVPKLASYRTLLLISSATIFFNAIGFNWVYSALEEYSYITIRSILFQFISLVLLFTFVKTYNDVVKYLAIGVFSSVGANICNAIHLRKYITFKTFGKQNLSVHIKPICVLFGMTIITSIYTMLDTTMLGFISGDEAVGYYSAATKINKMVLHVVTAACAVLFPRLSYYAKNDDKSQFYRLLNKSLSITLCFAIPATIGLNILSLQITLLFSGEKYLPAVPVMKIMNPIIIIIALSNFIGIQCLVPLKKEKLTLYSVCVGAFINFTLNIILISKYKAIGAGISTLVAESSVTIFQLIAARKYINFKPILINIFQYIIAATVMGFVVSFVCKLSCNLSIQIIASIFIGVIFYIVTLVILHNKIIIDFIIQLHNKKDKK